jgi:hypothetical protein
MQPGQIVEIASGQKWGDAQANLWVRMRVGVKTSRLDRKTRLKALRSAKHTQQTRDQLDEEFREAIENVQEITRRWRQNERPRYHCVTSDEVLRESPQGDAEMSRLRQAALAELPMLKTSDRVRLLATELVQRNLLPAKVPP